MASLALTLAAGQVQADGAYKEPSGKARAAILDAIRPEVEAAYQMRLKFAVRRLKSNGQYALALLVPKSLAGKRIEDSVLDAQHVDGLVHAILRNEAGTWRVIERALADGDDQARDWEAKYPAIPKDELCDQCGMSTPSPAPSSEAARSAVARPEPVVAATPPAAEQALALDAALELLLAKKIDRRSLDERAKPFAEAGQFKIVDKQHKTSGELAFESSGALHPVTLDYDLTKSGALSFTGIYANIPVASAVAATALHRKINQRLAKRLFLLYSTKNDNRADDMTYELSDSWQLDLRITKRDGQRRVLLTTGARDPDGF